MRHSNANLSGSAARLPHRHPVGLGRGRRNGRDAGVVLVVVIVCLVVAAAILASFTTVSVIARDSIRSEAWQLQARWLAESAIERAAAQLAADRAYDGESWTVSAEAMGTREGGVAAISVQGFADDPNRRLVFVQADYPDDPVHRCTLRKSVVIELPEPPTDKPTEEMAPEKTKETAAGAAKPAEEPAKPDAAKEPEKTKEPETPPQPEKQGPEKQEPTPAASPAGQEKPADAGATAAP